MFKGTAIKICQPSRIASDSDVRPEDIGHGSKDTVVKIDYGVHYPVNFLQLLVQ